MLTKTKLRALSPPPVNPNARPRLRVPAGPSGMVAVRLAGKEVDVCVIPCYGPRYG